MTAVRASLETQRSVWAEMVEEMDKARSWNQSDSQAERHGAFLEVQEFCQRKVNWLTVLLESM